MRRRLASMMQNDRARMELVFSLVFSFPGIPMIRYGDEIGMGEDLSLPGRKSTFIAVHNLSANNTTLNMNMSLIEGRVILADNTEGTFSEIAPYGYRWLLIPNRKK